VHARNGTRRTLTHGALAQLSAYDFPGNVRELENIVEQAAALAHTDEIENEDVFIETRTAPPLETPPSGVRTVRADLPLANMYLMLLTARESRGDLVTGFASLRARQVRGHRNKRVEARLDRFDPRETGLRQLHGRDTPIAYERGGVFEREVDRLADDRHGRADR